MPDAVQEAFETWKMREEEANRIGIQGAQMEQARQAATEAWHAYWERHWKAKQES